MATHSYRFVRYFAIAAFLFTFLICLYEFSSRDLLIESSTNVIFENDSMRLGQADVLPRLAVAYARDGSVYATEDHYIYKKPKNDNRFIEKGAFDKVNPSVAQRIKDFIARMRITRDCRRNFGANNIVVLKSKTILIFYDQIYRSIDGGETFQAVFDFRRNGVCRPFSHGIAVDKNDDVYFGEYNCTSRPQKVSILKGSDDGTRWIEFYSFPPGEIFHIHSMKYDPYRDVVWISSGDLDKESRLMFIDIQREKIEITGSGDQGWRIVSLITTEDCLYWCSDNDQTGANIYRYSFDKERREKIKFIGKPSYYSTRLADGTLVFSTTYEPASPYSRAAKPEPTADLWVSKDGTDWYKVLSVPGHIHETQYGPSRPTLILPAGDYSAYSLYVTPKNTLESDFSTRVLKVSWKEPVLSLK